jgi:integrase
MLSKAFHPRLLHPYYTLVSQCPQGDNLMSRRVRDAALETRTARHRLQVRKEPFYRLIEPGLFLGYRKLANSPGTWLVRRFNGNAPGGSPYTRTNITTTDGLPVIADDYSDANGETILSFAQAQERAKAFRPDARQAHGPHKVTEALADYFAHLREGGRPETLVREAENRAAALIVPKLGDKEVAALTTKQLRGWRDALIRSGARLRTRTGEAQKYRKADDGEDALRARRASANRVWTILRAALNYAFIEGKADNDSAWRRVKPFGSVERSRVAYLTVAESKRLLNACPPDFRQLVRAALETGARVSQLRELVVRDFDSDSKTVQLRTRKGNGEVKTYRCVLTDDGAALFADLCAGRAAGEPILRKADGRAWGESHQVRAMTAACAHAKIGAAVSFHSLRHTWASLAAMNGTPLLVIAQNLGHTDVRMVEKHYGHLAPSYVADAIRAGAPRFGMHKPGNVRPLTKR